MTMSRTLCCGLLFVAASLAAQDDPVYPLKPVVQTGRGPGRQYQFVRLDKNGEGELPFATASGKVRFKMDGEKVLFSCVDDGKFEEVTGKSADNQPTAKIPVKLAGKPFEYPLALNPARLSSSSGEGNHAVWAMGQLHLEAQAGQTTLRLYDSNLNGQFGDAGDMLQIGAEGSLRAVTKYVVMDGKIKELQIVNGGEAVKLLPYTGPTATLNLNPKEGWRTDIQLGQAEGLFVANAAKGTEALLLPGAYRVESAMAQFGESATTEGRAQPPVYFYCDGNKDASIQIKEGQNSLAFGPPFRLEFTAARSAAGDDKVNVTDAVLVGAGGEKYRANNYGSNGKSTLACYVRSAGKEEKVADMEYG
ncbi:MAG: hypothetical protein ABSE73_20680 [Planctomycetota bacterium]